MATSEDDIKNAPIRGVQFVTDPSGRRVAVILDLKEWGELWEDIYDTVIANRRVGEPTATLEEFERQLAAEGLIGERD